MSRVRYARPLFAVLIAGILAGLYFLTGAGHRAAAQPSAAAAHVAVSTAVRACAAPGSAAPTSASLAITASPGSASAGTAVISSLTPAGSTSVQPAIATLTKPGVLSVTSIKTAPPLTKAESAGQAGSSPQLITRAARGGIEISATGAMAQGLEAEQTGPGGLTTAQCGAPGTDFWFAGPGQAVGGNIDIYLMNTGNQAADAQVSVLTDVTNGPPLLANADSGITVPPHGIVMQSLTKLLQSSKVIALNVTTSVGQVTAAVRESRSASADGSWLPADQPPSQHVVIPGLPQAGSNRELYIAVPGKSSAQVKVTAVTQRGSYQPTGGTGIDLLGGSVASIALPSVGGIPGAIRITSTVPVVASMLVGGGPAGSAGAVAASSGPIVQQGVVANNPMRSAGSTQLVLSAAGKAARVRIATATASAAATGPGTIVAIKAGSSVVVPVSPRADQRATAFSVVLTPLSGSGPVYAGRVISVHGTVQSVLAVPSSLTSIVLPAVRSSLAAVLG